MIYLYMLTNKSKEGFKLKSMKSMKLISLVLIFIMMIGVAGCNKNTETKVDGDSEGEGSTDTVNMTSEEVVIKMFSNLPDRTSGQGLLEQTIIDKYMEENSNITIEVEALQDEPYKQKFQSYVASAGLPDILNVWGQPAFLQAVMENGYLAELDESVFSDYNFFGGSTTDFSYDGKLYGLPRGQDCTVIYYNKALFDSVGAKVPATYDDLLESSKLLRENGIAPLAINGKDKWILNLFFQDLVVSTSGDQNTIYDAIDQKTSFTSDEDIRTAAIMYKELVDAGLFQDSYLSADYGAAQNIFLQEQAAMFYMGGWEVGMASNPENSDSFKENVALIPFPTARNGKDSGTDLLAWNGGGYSISADSKVKDEAIKFLAYMMLPENWAKEGWQKGLVVPAQDYTPFLTGDENQLQLEVTEVLKSATSMSGTPWNDYAPGEWKTEVQDIIQEFSAGITSVDEMLNKLDEAAKRQ